MLLKYVLNLKVPELFTFLPSLLAVLFPIKLPSKRTKCCLRQSNLSKFSGEGYCQTPLRARAYGARWLVPTSRIHTSPNEIQLATGLEPVVAHLYLYNYLYIQTGTALRLRLNGGLSPTFLADWIKLNQYIKHPHIRRRGVRTSGWKLSN